LKNDEFSGDPAVVKAMNDDPLIANETQPTQTLAEMVRADERLRQEFPLITLPVLILHGTADQATKPSGSQRFYDHAGSTDKTLKLYDGHFHDLLNDVGKEAVMAVVLSWLSAHPPAARGEAGRCQRLCSARRARRAYSKRLFPACSRSAKGRSRSRSCTGCSPSSGMPLRSAARNRRTACGLRRRRVAWLAPGPTCREIPVCGSAANISSSVRSSPNATMTAGGGCCERRCCTTAALVAARGRTSTTRLPSRMSAG